MNFDIIDIEYQHHVTACIGMVKVKDIDISSLNPNNSALKGKVFY